MTNSEEAYVVAAAFGLDEAPPIDEREFFGYQGVSVNQGYLYYY